MVSSAKKSSRSHVAGDVPGGDHPLDLFGDRLGVAPHVPVAERLVVEHLPAAFGGGVEHDALAEHRGHERVGLGLVELLLRGPEVPLVGLGAGHEHDPASGEVERAHLAALVADALHQPDGVGLEVAQVARAGPPPPLTMRGSRAVAHRGGVGAVGHVSS